MESDPNFPDMGEETRQAAMERLFPAVYDELRALAKAHLRHERSDRVEYL